MDSVNAVQSKVQLPEGVPPFVCIFQNDVPGRKQKKLKDDDIAVCECKYRASDSESACGEGCLNVLTNTECVPGYCPCGDNCMNQKFQKCEYTKTKLFHTEGRGWGLLAEEDIKAGQFVIEYCGEVISVEEAKKRAQTYEERGLKDAYIISLNANNFIDATKKGSMARFINHSCMPNCETRKWTVLGETRVGIFAKQDISAGTELSYDYNFEWYGGVTVRCLCGATNCSIFLGAKSQGFQECNHVWEEGDDRYPVEEIPIYDSAEDDDEHTQAMQIDTVMPHVDAATTIPTEKNLEKERDPKDFHFQQNDEPVMSRMRSNSGDVNYTFSPGQSTKKKPASNKRRQRGRTARGSQVDMENVAKLFPTKEAQEEVTRFQEVKKEATSKLNAVYDEIRPTIEERERDQQDTIPTSVAEKWISAHCAKLRADLDFSFSIIQNALRAKKPDNEGPSSGAGANKPNNEGPSSGAGAKKPDNEGPSSGADNNSK